jgi:hypothetical protein
MEMRKEQSGQITVSSARGIGSTVPHSGQKFESPLKQDMAEEKQPYAGVR